jgi:hypothetical protein
MRRVLTGASLLPLVCAPCPDPGWLPPCCWSLLCWALAGFAGFGTGVGSLLPMSREVSTGRVG